MPLTSEKGDGRKLYVRTSRLNVKMGRSRVWTKSLVRGLKSDDIFVQNRVFPVSTIRELARPKSCWYDVCLTL